MSVNAVYAEKMFVENVVGPITEFGLDEDVLQFFIVFERPRIVVG